MSRSKRRSTLAIDGPATMLVVITAAMIAIAAVSFSSTGRGGSARHASNASSAAPRSGMPARSSVDHPVSAQSGSTASPFLAPSVRDTAPLGVSQPSLASPKAVLSPPPTPTVAPTTWGCGAATSYLSTHAAPDFSVECPGYALGHEAMTCVDQDICPGERLIIINVACPAAYMNEASNSWVLTGSSAAQIDPFGSCSART